MWNRDSRLPLQAFTAWALLCTAWGVPQAAAEPPREPGTPPLTTPWTDRVGPGNAHPEYPRPQLVRERWQSLNGLWQYATGEAEPVFDRQILVPFPPESALSGIQRHDDHMWYRRTFDVPPDWHGQRLLLHFGAVDQLATVWVNGTEVATHSGGYAGFNADVTDALRDTGPQELLVAAIDGGDAADFPVGKQTNTPGGVYYTQTSGIWQSVWLEPVPTTYLTGIDITPSLADGSFEVTTGTDGLLPAGMRVHAVVSEPGGRAVAESTGAPGTPIHLRIPDPHRWSPDDPYLYDVRVRLMSGEHEVDAVDSYAGMREISLRPDSQGRPRMALNGSILFQQGVLDQGFWPDGIYTAPTDEALRSDLEHIKRLGFNMVRKHVKVEPQRWYYWADRLGLLVWQDMPSLFSNNAPYPDPPRNQQAAANFRAGLHELIDQHRNSPSIVVWVPFNEGWGEFDTAGITGVIHSADPTRLVDANSGVNCCYSLPDSGAGDIYDDHTYVGPGRPAVHDDRAVVDGEYGGLGLVLNGHLWPGEPNAYEMTDSTAELTQRYGDLSDALLPLIHNDGLSAAIYTQITDVENEVNGLLTYDRRALKADAGEITEHNRRAIAAASPSNS